MNSKFILLLGGVLSSLIVFFCLKNQYKQLIETKPSLHNIVKTEKLLSIESKKNIPIKPKKIKLKNPTTNYVYGKEITSEINLKDKDFGDKLKKLCKEKNCTANIIYSNNYKKANWKELLIQIINFLNKNKLDNSYIKANGNDVKIKVTIDQQKLFEKYNYLIRTYTKENINLTNLASLSIPKKQPKNKTSINIAKIQKQINKILKQYPIYFSIGSNHLTKKGKKSLNSIIQYFKKYPNTRFVLYIAGHTDARGIKKHNQILSQKRADIVKTYLLKRLKNLEKVSAIGYGDSKPKYKDKKNPKNRRVEIIIKKGIKK